MTTDALSDAESCAPNQVIVDDHDEFNKLRDTGTVWHRDGYTAIATTVNGITTNFIHVEDAE
jgi:hypothetical protein